MRGEERREGGGGRGYWSSVVVVFVVPIIIVVVVILVIGIYVISIITVYSTIVTVFTNIIITIPKWPLQTYYIISLYYIIFHCPGHGKKRRKLWSNDEQITHSEQITNE